MVGKDKALYLAALKNTLPMYSETGRMDPKGAAAVLAVFSQSSPDVAKANIDLSKTYTNKYRRCGQQEDGNEVSSANARGNLKAASTAGDFPAVSVIVEAMNILSIQSHVAYGHVGNSAAVFPLQRMGVEVWPIHTVQFSNHTGYGDWQGQVFDAGLIREVVGGIEQRGVLGECDGVLSGYMGGADIGAAILDAVATVKRANPAARYCCDPVIGDVGRGIFVREGIPEFMKEKAVPAADIITPNQFELDYLAGRESKTLADALGGGRSGARARAARRPGDLAAYRRHAGGRHRPAGLGRDRPLSPAHAEAAAGGERRGRRHRRAVLRALSAQRQDRRGAVARRLRHLWRAGQDRGARRA